MKYLIIIMMLIPSITSARSITDTYHINGAEFSLNGLTPTVYYKHKITSKLSESLKIKAYYNRPMHIKQKVSYAMDSVKYDKSVSISASTRASIQGTIYVDKIDINYHIRF